MTPKEIEYDYKYEKLRDELDYIVLLYLKGEGIDYLFREVKRIEKAFVELRETYSR